MREKREKLSLEVDGKRWCSRCKVIKLTIDFGRSGKGYWCKPCVNTYQYDWNKKNPERRHIWDRRGMLRRMYGITPEEYDKLLMNQNGGCAICGEENKRKKSKHLHVDHCHATGKVRGLLCDLCNRGLGYFKDEPKKLQSAIQYLMHEELRK